MKEPLAIVSVSGGKDSTATAILALDRMGNDRCRFVFADTGNEHQITLDYINDYLPKALGIKIDTVRADFSVEIERKRAYVLSHWAKKGVPDDIIARATAALVPHGIPFLDLCIWKGRFPSRMAQFCTQFLKRLPLEKYIQDVMAEGFEAESWRGIRRDESERRKGAVEREFSADGYWIVHPIVAWTAQQTVDFVLSHQIRLNPLYSEGMGRVGCMPCINCVKDELLETATRFSNHIDKIELWESLVGDASKRGFASFFTERAEDDESPEDVFDRGNIRQKIQWARTSRGGKQFDLLRDVPTPSCTSQYGLCE